MYALWLWPAYYFNLQSPSTQDVHHYVSAWQEASVVSAVPFHIPSCWICRCYSAKVMGSITPGKWQLRNTPICQRWMFFFWQVIGFECSMEHQWGEPKDNICLSRHVSAIDGDILFSVPSKKSPVKFAESTHKRQPHVWKRTESDKFVCACVSGKKSFKAGHRDEKKRHSSSPLLSPPPHLLSHPRFLLFFSESSRM